MEKFKLDDAQRYNLLDFCHRSIVSQGEYPFHFLSPKSCYKVKFITGFFYRETGSRVEIVYTFDTSTVRLLLFYSKENLFGDVSDYVFVPKMITIDRDFKSSLLISIIRHPETSFCCPTYIYQSHLSIPELCVEDSVEGESVDVELGSVCPVGVLGDTPLPDENKHSVTSHIL